MSSALALIPCSPEDIGAAFLGIEKGLLVCTCESVEASGDLLITELPRKGGFVISEIDQWPVWAKCASWFLEENPAVQLAQSRALSREVLDHVEVEITKAFTISAETVRKPSDIVLSRTAWSGLGFGPVLIAGNYTSALDGSVRYNGDNMQSMQCLLLETGMKVDGLMDYCTFLDRRFLVALLSETKVHSLERFLVAIGLSIAHVNVSTQGLRNLIRRGTIDADCFALIRAEPQ